MRNLVLALVLAAPLMAATPLPAVKAALKEAHLQMSAGQWHAATRALTDLRSRLALDPADQALKTQVEMIMWDVRMGFTEHALRDLDRLEAALKP